MNKEDIIRMAQEAGWSGTYVIQWADEPTGEPDWNPVEESMPVPVTMEQIERFAALVAKRAVSNIDPASWMSWQEGYAAGVAAEREACAKVCEDDVRTWSHPGSITRVECAAAIRTRGNT